MLCLGLAEALPLWLPAPFSHDAKRENPWGQPLCGYQKVELGRAGQQEAPPHLTLKPPSKLTPFPEKQRQGEALAHTLLVLLGLIKAKGSFQKLCRASSAPLPTPGICSGAAHDQ